MTQIDYKGEVLKKFPDAKIKTSIHATYVKVVAGRQEKTLSVAPTEQAAWQSAYERLVSEGKLQK